MKNYNLTADCVKGILILLVVVGHIIPDSTIRYLIYSFHMPVFLAIFGYFISKEVLSTKNKFTKKICRLLVPYVCASLIYFVFWNFSSLSIKGFLKALIVPGFHLWFLSAAFIHLLILKALNEFSVNISSIIHLVCIILISIFLYKFVNIPVLEMKRTLAWFLFSWLGFSLSCKDFNYKFNNKILLTLYSLLLCIKIYLDFHTEGFPVLYILNSNISIVSSLLYVLNNTLLVLIVINYIDNYQSLKIPFLNYLGANSMTVYLWHVVFIQALGKIGINNMFLVFIVSIMLCLPLVRLAQVSKIFRFLFEGKR